MTGRALGSEERALWNRVAATVTPLRHHRPPPAPAAPHAAAATPPQAHRTGPVEGPRKQRPPTGTTPGLASAPAPAPVPAPTPAPTPAMIRARARAAARDGGLDGHWERRLRRGEVRPDVSIDLHGHTLAVAHRAVDAALSTALAQGGRVVLIVAGRQRPDAHGPAPTPDGPRPRGAIRAALPGWLGSGPFADHIAAIRPAHAAHGGGGAVYVILRRG